MTAATPKGERRRQALVEAASALLVEGGFDAVRHRAVAERAGLPLASTTYYFDSLDELITAAVEFHGHAELASCRERLTGLSDRLADTDVLVELVLDLLVGQDVTDTETMLLRYERLVATGRRPYLRPLMRVLSTELHELIAEIFTRSGRDITAERVEELIALVDGTMVNAFIELKPDPRGAAARMLRSALSRHG
ncbi:transcriptional regulator, TetR family [Lentzea xinjiangensis]|uniref:Transcriptional regulator, TetR family n=1 Tax=Lentzea xinjiangensis TaxID=402600 RepID=A0A1H9AKU4_9PSEU|nr:TetR family transcriptional regulator C-terminal domain-containing protein [Lentzea xinjiangensis]SEP77131.1 transcriptional regulator, TetR family [Lentzea xinjiangensis]